MTFFISNFSILQNHPTARLTGSTLAKTEHLCYSPCLVPPMSCSLPVAAPATQCTFPALLSGTGLYSLLSVLFSNSFYENSEKSDFNSLSRKGSGWFRQVCAYLGLLFTGLFLRNNSSKIASATSFKKWLISTPNPAKNGIKQLENPLFLGCHPEIVPPFIPQVQFSVQQSLFSYQQQRPLWGSKILAPLIRSTIRFSKTNIPFLRHICRVLGKMGKETTKYGGRGIRYSSFFIEKRIPPARARPSSGYRLPHQFRSIHTSLTFLFPYSLLFTPPSTILLRPPSNRRSFPL